MEHSRWDKSHTDVCLECYTALLDEQIAMDAEGEE